MGRSHALVSLPTIVQNLEALLHIGRRMVSIDYCHDVSLDPEVIMVLGGVDAAK